MGNYVNYFLPVSETAMTDLRVTACGFTHVPPNSSYPLTKHPERYHFSWSEGRILNSCQLVYLTEGQGFFETSITPRVLVGAGDVFILFPGVWHRYSPLPDTGWTEHWFELEGIWLHKLISEGAVRPTHPVLRPGILPILINQFDVLHTYAQLGNPLVINIISALARLLMELTLYHAIQPETHSRTIRLVHKLQMRLVETSEVPSKLKDIAQSLHTQESHLRRSFKSHTGHSPKRYATLIRLRKASVLFAGTDLSIKQIAAQLGFSSAFHLSSAFKREFGQSPDNWRKSRNTEPPSLEVTRECKAEGGRVSN